MANSLTVEQKAKEFPAGNRRAIKTCLSPSLHISSKEGTSCNSSSTQREEREDVRENNSTFLSLLLYSFLAKRVKKGVLKSQREKPGCQVAFLQHLRSEVAVTLANIFISQGVLWAVLFFLSPHGKSVRTELTVCFYQSFSLPHTHREELCDAVLPSSLAMPVSSSRWILSLHCKLRSMQMGRSLNLPRFKSKVRSPTLVSENHRVHTQVKKINPISHFSLIVLRPGGKWNKE